MVSSVILSRLPMLTDTPTREREGAGVEKA